MLPRNICFIKREPVKKEKAIRTTGELSSLCRFHSREIEQKIFVYRTTFSDDFHCNLRGVFLEKILPLQHATVRNHTRDSLHLPACHLGAANSPPSVGDGSHVSKQLKTILHRLSLESTHTIKYTAANFHFILTDLTKCDWRAYHPGQTPWLQKPPNLLKRFPMVAGVLICIWSPSPLKCGLSSPITDCAELSPLGDTAHIFSPGVTSHVHCKRCSKFFFNESSGFISQANPNPEG